MRIEETEIHLWQLNQADFDLSELESRCLPWLSEPQLTRYRRLQFERHRKQLLLGRALIRVVLSSYDSSISPADWRFTQNQYGKPAISAQQNSGSIYFNLSHSAERAVLAVSRFPAIGIDIEYSLKPRRVSAIAQRYFSTQELVELLALPGRQQLERFYDLWTLKEAYIKACGMGLAIPLQHFSYSFLDDDGLGIAFDARRDDEADAWQLWQCDAGSDYKLALAAKPGRPEQAHTLSSWSLLGLDDFQADQTVVVRSK